MEVYIPPTKIAPNTTGYFWPIQVTASYNHTASGNSSLVLFINFNSEDLCIEINNQLGQTIHDEAGSHVYQPRFVGTYEPLYIHDRTKHPAGCFSQSGPGRYFFTATLIERL